MSTRLPGPKYKNVFDRGRSIKGRLLVAWYLTAEGLGREAGVVVSKKTLHEAVDRNRAKRLMREAFRLSVQRGVMPANTAWVLIARRGIAQKKCGDVMEELAWCVRRSSSS